MNYIKNRYIFVNYILFVFSIIGFLFLKDDKLLFYLAWISNLVFLASLFNFTKLYGTIFNRFNIFNISFFLFSFGQVFLFSFGLSYEKYDLLSLEPTINIIKYTIYFLYSFWILLIVQLKFSFKELREKDINCDDKIREYNKKLYTIYLIIFIITFPIYFSDLYSMFKVTKILGYTSLFDGTYTESRTILSSLSFMFIPSVYILLYLKKENILYKYTLLFLLIISVIINLIIGFRGESIAILLGLIYLWDNTINRISKQYFVYFFILMLLLITILPTIQIFRTSSFIGVNDFFKMYLDSITNNNPFINIVGELGGSMNPWLKTYNLVPNYKYYDLGFSYISAFMSILPSFFFLGFSFSNRAYLSGWLKGMLNMKSGPGFSILAELYYNFGWFGIPMMLIVGSFYSKLLVINNKNLNRYFNRHAFISISLFLLSVSARSSLHLIVREYFYVILVPMLAADVFSNNK